MANVAASADAPGNQPINREAVKTLAMAIGIREAARRMGLDEHRVLKWSQRDPNGPWMSSPEVKQLSTPSTTGNTARYACPQNVLTASNALQNVLSEDRAATKLGFSQAARKAAEHLAKADPETILHHAAKARDMATVAEKAQDWASGQQAIAINVFDDVKLIEAIEVESQVVDNQ